MKLEFIICVCIALLYLLLNISLTKDAIKYASGLIKIHDGVFQNELSSVKLHTLSIVYCVFALFLIDSIKWNI